MKTIVLIILIGILSSNVVAQDRYIVYFKDKAQIEQYDNKKLLSEKTIYHRSLFGIGFDSYDLPVKVEYLKSLKDNGVKVLSTSKWLNAALLETSLSKENLLALNSSINKVTSINLGKKARTSKFFGYEKNIFLSNNRLEDTITYYGFAEEQNSVFEIRYLHDKGLKGDGVTVAFIDAGYNAMDTISYFDSVFVHNRIIDTYDYWSDTSFVFHKMSHGMGVSSIMLANKPGMFVGMAPNVNLMFFITDDEETETHQDEYFFVKALERADSIGVDIVNASLGYQDFDEGEYDYNYSDMDGNTAISTIGCNIAASKGILVVTSAGNGGYITAPADAYGILSIGGATLLKKYDNMSSYGPTYDGRLKPDVAGITRNVRAIRVTGSIALYNYGGTSSAAPFITGLTACLKQAHPNASSSVIINAILQSGHQANNPDNHIGFGVPNARVADSILSITYGVNEFTSKKNITIYPNPSKSDIFIESNITIESISIISVIGNIIKEKVNFDNNTISVGDFQKGTYILRIIDNSGLIYNKKIIVN